MLNQGYGEPQGFQSRPDDPRFGSSGKPIKYETPSGQKMVLDCPLRVRPHLGDPTKPLIITEGIRKADSAVTAGLDCLALLGVWFAMQLVNAGAVAVTASTTGGGVAFMAHVAGFVTGAIAIFVFKRREPVPLWN